jgi:hypothetical protein
LVDRREVIHRAAFVVLQERGLRLRKEEGDSIGELQFFRGILEDIELVEGVGADG